MFMTKKVKTLLSVEPYKFTGNQLGEVKRKCNNRPYLDKILPKYCFRKDNNLIDDTNCYLQFIYDGEEEYILFDIQTVDKLLQLEIDEAGFADEYGLLRYNNNKDTYNEEVFFNIVKNYFKIHSFKDYNWIYPVAQYIVIELEYCNYSYENPYETDLHINIIGHLNSNNNNLEFIKYKNDRK